MSEPLVILSDLHLSHTGSESTFDALASLMQRCAGHEVVLAGDIFSLSSDLPSRDPAESVTTLLRRSRATLRALREHLSEGNGVSLVAGNHDSALMHARMRSALLAVLELTDAANLQLNPWFLRRGGLHVEHGHMWDPDNAPAHPLSAWSLNTEPLGILLTRRFVARRGVWQFAHAHETTLVQGFKRAFQLFGMGAPLLVAQYFATSARICTETLFDRGLSAEREAGDLALGDRNLVHGVSELALRELLARAPQPTHTRFDSTFLRLYYDRVLCALGLVGGGVGALAGGGVLAGALAAASCAYLALNVRKSGARYHDRPVRLLRDGAAVVRAVTGAETVVFGHTHVPVLEAGYANAGSFGYPVYGKGRPYLRVDAGGQLALERV